MGGDISVNQNNMKMDQLREAVKDFDGGIAAKWDQKGGVLLYESKDANIGGKLNQVQQSMKNSGVSPQAQAMGKALFYEILANTHGEKYADQIFDEFAGELFNSNNFLTADLIERADNRVLELVKNASMQGVQNQNEPLDEISADSDSDVLFDESGLTDFGDNVNVEDYESPLSKIVTNPEHPNIGGNGNDIEEMDDLDGDEFINEILSKYEEPDDDEPVISKENKNPDDVNNSMKLDEHDEFVDDIENIDFDETTKNILAGSEPKPNTKPEKSGNSSNVIDPMALDVHDEIYEEELVDYDPDGNDLQDFIKTRPEENKNVNKSGNDQNPPIQQNVSPKQTETKPNSPDPKDSKPIPQRNDNTRVRKTSRKNVSDPNEALANAQKKLNDIGKKVNDGKKLLENLRDDVKANRLRQRKRLTELRRRRRTRSDETNRTTRSKKSGDVNSARQARYRKQLLRANRNQGWEFWNKVNDGGNTKGIPNFGALLELARPDPKEDILVGEKISNNKQGRYLKKELRNAVLAAFQNYPTRLHLLSDTQKTELAIKVMRARLSASNVANSMPERSQSM